MFITLNQDDTKVLVNVGDIVYISENEGTNITMLSRIYFRDGDTSWISVSESISQIHTQIKRA